MPDDCIPAPSVVMEWENVRQSGRARVKLVLSELVTQMRHLQGRFAKTPELIVTFRRTHIEPMELQDLLADVAGAGGWPCTIHLLAAEADEDYYQQKNRGAFAAGNEIVVFLDSDVRPAGGWLEAMLLPFLQWEVSALAGATSCESDSFYGKATGLFWLLPPPPPRQGVQPLQAYFANNLAFRRAIFLRVPFPQSQAYRGHCALQLRELQSMGLVVLQQTDALTLHPPPPGISGFMGRAWNAGTGAHVHLSLHHQASLRLPFTNFRSDLRLLGRRVQERSPIVRASPAVRAAGRVLGFLYFAVKAAGHLYRAGRHRAGRQSPHPTASAMRSAPSATGPV